MPLPLAVTTFTTAANAYIAAVQANPSDPSLGAALAALPALCASAIDAITTAAVPEMGPVVLECEVLLAQCSDLGDAALSATGSLTTFTVPVPMSLMQVLGLIYGASALQYVDATIQNNPGIIGFVLLPAGTVVALPTAS